MSNEILTKQDGQILNITINRPDNGNGMTDAMVVEMTGIIREAPKNSRIIVLRGAGKEFCIGRAGMGARPAGPPPAPPEAYARRNESDIVFDAYGIMRIGADPGRRRGAGQGARLRLRHRRRVRRDARQRCGDLPGAGDGP